MRWFSGEKRLAAMVMDIGTKALNKTIMTKMQEQALEGKLAWKKNDEARRMKDDIMKFRTLKINVDFGQS
ncbi:unnamed protein product [Lathyrus oleraceus]